MKLRGAVVGCGMISEFHLRAWRRIPEVEIVALVDPETGRAKQSRDAFYPAAEVFSDMMTMLQCSCIDFVDILTPPWVHREQCLQAAKRNLHIICQKPLCDRWDEADSLVQELRNYRQLFCVHENHPFRPWFRRVLKQKEEGFFGDLHEVQLWQRDVTEPPEKFKTQGERGILLDYGIHLVAMAQTLLGKPDSVGAHLEKINPRVRAESRAQLTFSYPEAKAQVEVAWQDGGEFSGGFTLQGSQGACVYTGTLARGNESRFCLFHEGEEVENEVRSPTADYAESFFLFQRDFVDALISGSCPPQPVSDNLQILKTVFEAYESATDVRTTPTSHS